jgi:excisionase family DNA binding protein
MNTTAAPDRRLLTTAEVARIFRVDPRTVARWANAGRIGWWRTPGGHKRFFEDEVRAFLNGSQFPPADNGR